LNGPDLPDFLTPRDIVFCINEIILPPVELLRTIELIYPEDEESGQKSKVKRLIDLLDAYEN
jgi:hypothetical protein